MVLYMILDVYNTPEFEPRSLNQGVVVNYDRDELKNKEKLTVQTGLEPATITIFHLYINTKYSLKVVRGANGAPITRTPMGEKVSDARAGSSPAFGIPFFL